MTYTTDHLNPEILNAFVDQELSAAESQAVQQHIASCPSCAVRVLTATKLKAATARAGQRFAVPPDALARLTAKLQTEQPKKSARIYWFRHPGWAALAAMLVLAISLIGWQRIFRANPLSAELVDQHLARLSSGAPPEVISTDRHTVKPWFQGKLPFSFNLPDSLPPDTTLKGADLTYLNGQPAALLVFTIHKHEVSVFLIQRGGIAVLPAGRDAVRSGFDVRYATTQDLHIIAVSDVNPAELGLLVAALVQAQSPR